MTVARAITVPGAATMASPATTAATVARRRGNIPNIGVSKSDESHPFLFFETKYVKFYIL
jgi:hypothetical protein